MNRDTATGYIKIQKKNDVRPSRNNYILAIAIDNYQHWSTLKNPVFDIQKITEILVRKYHFNLDKITFLLNEDATEKNILIELEKLAKNLTPNDNLLLFFSGHGHFNKGIDLGYWIPVNAKLEDPSTYISNANIKHLLSKVNTHHTTLIVDSCFSGTLLTRKRNAPQAENFPSKKVFASGREEVVEDGIPGMHSPFARGIINFLESNTKKIAKLRDLISYVIDYVEKNTGKMQNPVDGSLPNDGNGEFILYQKLSEEESWEASKRQNTVESFESFVKDFPESKHLDQAKKSITTLIEEERRWKSIQDSDLIDDFIEFITAYPQSRFVALAQNKINHLKRNHKQSQELQEQMASELSQIERTKARYASIYYDAERLYNVKKYKDARKKFQDAKALYIPSKQFLPTIENLDKKINSCTEEMNFLNFYAQGEEAFSVRNYTLAKDLFSKALKIKPGDLRAIQLIEKCNSSINPIKYVNPPALDKPKVRVYPKHYSASVLPPPPPEIKGGKPITFYIFWGFIILVIVLGILLNYFQL